MTTRIRYDSIIDTHPLPNQKYVRAAWRVGSEIKANDSVAPKAYERDGGCTPTCFAERASQSLADDLRRRPPASSTLIRYQNSSCEKLREDEVLARVASTFRCAERRVYTGANDSDEGLSSSAAIDHAASEGWPYWSHDRQTDRRQTDRQTITLTHHMWYSYERPPI